MSAEAMAMVQRGAGRPAMDMDGDAAGGDDPVRTHRARTLWVPTTVVLLGAWLVFGPATFGYSDPTQAPAAVQDLTGRRGPTQGRSGSGRSRS